MPNSRRHFKFEVRLAAYIVALAIAAASPLLALLEPASIVVCGQAALPGGVIKVVVDGRVAAKARCYFNGRRYRLFPAGKVYRALVPVEVDAQPWSSGTVTVHYKSLFGDKVLYSGPVRVGEPDFDVIKLKISRRKTKLYRDPAVPDARKLISRALSKRDQEQQWRGLFIMPVSGRISAPFGQRRVRRNKTLSYHLGMDIAASSGTVVAAVNDGVVAVAGYFPLQGNAVIINHGQGVFSACYHMSALATREGLSVKKGDAVGKVGSTGISTGPHVHWSMFIHGVPVNPADWTRIVY